MSDKTIPRYILKDLIYEMQRGSAQRAFQKLIGGSKPPMPKDRQIVLMLIRRERELLKEFDHEDFGVAARCEYAQMQIVRKEAQRILRGGQ